MGLALLASPQGDRKGPHPAPHRPRPYNDPLLCDTPLVLIVRAGAVWSGVGTLAVALGEEMCQGERERGVGRGGVARPWRENALPAGALHAYPPHPSAPAP